MRAGGTRWAVSFADICLLLLGFSLIAQVHRKDGQAMAEGIRQHLGGRPSIRQTIDPARMFEAGEAVLRKGAPALGRFTGADTITIESRGADGGGDLAGARFDGWELAAARTAALARAVTAAGATPDRVTIDMAAAPGRHTLVVVRR